MNSSQRTTNDNSDHDFCPSTEIDLQEFSFQEKDFSHSLREAWVKDLGCQCAVLFSMITTLSARFGYCFMTDKTFSKRIGVSVSSIERWMAILDKKKYIYRNSYQTREGKKRHIVPKDLLFSYWKNFLARPCIPENVKKAFLDKFFSSGLPSNDTQSPIPNPQISTKREPPPKNAGSYATRKDEGSILLRNIRSIKREQRTEEKDVVVSFEELIKEELQNIGIYGERVKVAQIYYQKNKKAVEGKKNPIGWIIAGIKKGWIEDILEKPELEKNIQPKKKPRKLPEERVLNAQQASHVRNFLEKLKEKVDQKHLEIILEKEKYEVGYSNTKIRSFYRYDKPGVIQHMRISCINLDQEEGLKYIEKISKEGEYERL